MKKLLLLIMLCCVPALYAQTLHSGTFSKKKEKIEGSFTIKNMDGKKVLILDDAFKTKKGPDLQVVLSPLLLDGTNGDNALSQGAISLGALKSNKGSQRYSLPDDLDLSVMRSLLIHCVKYSKLWGGASLQ